MKFVNISPKIIFQTSGRTFKTTCFVSLPCCENILKKCGLHNCNGDQVYGKDCPPNSHSSCSNATTNFVQPSQTKLTSAHEFLKLIYSPQSPFFYYLNSGTNSSRLARNYDNRPRPTPISHEFERVDCISLR